MSVPRISTAASVGTLLAAISIVAAFAPTLLADSGDLVTLPLANLGTATSTQSGLSLTVDSRWIDNYGYRPLRVQANAPTPATTERLVTIQVHLEGWNAGWRQLVVEQDLVIPVGATSASTTVAVPTFQAWNQLWWRVWVDGFEDKELSRQQTAAGQITLHGQNSGRSWQPDLWILELERPDLGEWATARLLAPQFVLAPTLPKQVRPALKERAGIETCYLADLPTRWIDYSCIDIILVTPQELVVLAQSHPASLEAVRRWVHAGGALWVSDVGDAWNLLATIEKLLELPSESARGESQYNGNLYVPLGWKGSAELDHDAFGPSVSFVDMETGALRTVRDERQIALLMNNPAFAPLNDDDDSEEVIKQLRRAERWFIQHPLGFGTVRAYRGPWNRTPVSDSLLTTERWVTRHGLAPNDTADEFNNWLVPDVGLAPVTLFRVLITLFVLVIGPLNYLVLQKSGRLHLMILTVPVAAAIVACGLFLYAILADGLDTRIRVRSVTILDQRNEEAVSWARLSYYAGLAPSGGLALDADAVYYPILPEWYDGLSNLQSSTRHEILWTDSAQRLTRGWLKSRTPTQYLTISAQASRRKMEFHNRTDGLRATNRLGTTVKLLLALDHDARLFEGTNLDDGATAMLSPISPADAAGKLRRFLISNAPEFPSGYVGTLSDYASDGRRNRRLWMQSGVAYGGETLNENRLSKFIESLPNLFNDDSGEMAPPFYVAITETAPEVAQGVRSAIEQESFNVLIGNW